MTLCGCGLLGKDDKKFHSANPNVLRFLWLFLPNDLDKAGSDWIPEGLSCTLNACQWTGRGQAERWLQPHRGRAWELEGLHGHGRRPRLGWTRGFPGSLWMPPGTPHTAIRAWLVSSWILVRAFDSLPSPLSVFREVSSLTSRWKGSITHI